MDVRNINQIFVAKDCARTASVQIHDASNGTTYIGAGEVVIVNEFGTVLNDTTATKVDNKEIYIVGRTSDGLSTYKSAPIVGKGLQDLNTKLYAAAVEQITYLGWNGASGTFAATLTADTLYNLRLTSLYMGPLHDEVSKSFAYKSGAATPVDADVVIGLAQNFSFSNNVDLDFSVKCESLCAHAGGTIAQTATVTNGTSSIIMSAGTTFVAGDYIRVGGTATTDPVYKIKTSAASGATLTIEGKFQGTSAAGVTVERITAAQGIDPAEHWGLKFTGLAMTFEPGIWKYRKEMFDIQVGTVITSDPEYDTDGSKGVGTYDEVREMEWLDRTYFGNNTKVHSMYPVDFPLSAISTETYDLTTISWINEETQNIEGSTLQQGTITLAVAVGAGQADGATSCIKETLNAYINTGWGIGTAIIYT